MQITYFEPYFLDSTRIYCTKLDVNRHCSSATLSYKSLRACKLERMSTTYRSVKGFSSIKYLMEIIESMYLNIRIEHLLRTITVRNVCQTNSQYRSRN